MQKLNQIFPKAYIFIGILKIASLLIFGISLILNLNPLLLNTTKELINIIEPIALLLTPVVIILNICTKTKGITGYFIPYLTIIIEYIMSNSTYTLIAKLVITGYLYIISGRQLIKKINYKKTTNLNLTGKIISTIYLLIITICILIKLICNTMIYLNRNIEKVSSLENIQEPIQVDLEKTKIIKRNFENVYLDVVATYEISGRVTNTHKYNSLNTITQTSPLDVTITWGKTATNKTNKNVKYYSIGDRHVYNKILDLEGYNNNEMSNNHLIPESNKIKEELNMIKIGDYIKLEGMLVNIKTKNSSMSTSVYRDDTGSGACEVMYVTKVTWLKK